MKISTEHSFGTFLSRAAGFGGILLVVLAISGCTRGSQGIFATIEVEEKTKTSNLVDNTSASALVRADLGGKRFVVQAGTKIFTRLISGSDWSAISAPSGYRPTFLAGIDRDSSADGIVEEVYAVFFDEDPSDYHIYRLAENGGALSWDRIDDAAIWDPSGGQRITGFEGTGDRLLLSSSDGRLYSIAPDAVSREDLGAFTTDTRGIRAVATDSDGTTVVVGNTVHVTNDLSSPGTLSAAADTIEHGRGVTTFPSTLESGDPIDAFLLVTLDGKLYTSADGNTWTEADADSNIPNQSFSGVAWVDHQALLTVGTISYAGKDIESETSARGYYEVTSSPSGTGAYSFSFTNDEISDNYDGSELATSGIARFVYYDTDTTLLFALTHGRGLWRTAYEDSGPVWFWE